MLGGGSVALWNRRIDNREQPPGDTSDARFAVIDVETTGLSASNDRILELTVLRCDGRGRLIDEWTTRFNPQGPVGATHIHGITDADVASAPLFPAMAPYIAQRLSGLLPVAHNARFDLAFLRAEYTRAGWSMPWTPTLCTLDESRVHLPHLARRRLPDCCDAAGVRHAGAHTSLGDSRATAALLAMYLNSRRAPDNAYDQLIADARKVAWPTGPTRSPQPTPELTRQQIRIRARVTRQTERLVELLDTLDLGAVVPAGSPAGAGSYIELLAEVLEDGVVSDEEASALREIATLYELSVEDVADLHRAFLLALANKAVDDDTISRAERNELEAVADLLDIARSDVAVVLTEAGLARRAAKSVGLAPLPAGWSLGDPLRVGDSVAFTGCDEGERAHLESRARTMGVKVSSSVSPRTAMLVTDGSFAGTKLDAAQRHGTRQVRPRDFAAYLDHLQPSESPGTPSRATPRAPFTPTSVTKARSTASSNGTPSPSDVRAWARANGIAIGDRGRIPQDVFDAYASASAQPDGAPAADERLEALEPRVPIEPTPLAEAGWYPDPHGSGRRWWDGYQWTEHVQPVPPTPPAGWYARPDGRPGLQYWDGIAWTPHQAGR